ncbi:hypothetical protein K3729_13535 [Rhodobacteraceae bacterium S2214]|nr:hypothetical protein K3729_13535 [Rhodobacteraceae bacterium S2214]
MTHPDSEPPLEVLANMIGELVPGRIKQVGRRVSVGSSGEIDATSTQMKTALSALVDPKSDQLVDAEVVCELAYALSKNRQLNDEMEENEQNLFAHVDRRWDALAEPLVKHLTVSYSYLRKLVFDAFPKLKFEPSFFAQIVSAIGSNYLYDLDDLLSFLPDIELWQARQMIDALDKANRSDKVLSTSVFAALGKSLDWSPWIALQVILRARPDYADPNAVFDIEGDRNRESQKKIDARLEISKAIEPLCKVRKAAAILLELFGNDAGWAGGSLLSRPAEVKGAFVDALLTATSGDIELRQAVIEALLWLSEGQTADLAQFAAVSLANAEDQAFIAKLEDHPVQIVRFSARAVRASKFGETLDASALPTTGGLVQSLVALEQNNLASSEPARTWLGDRAVEQLIERTIASVENQFAKEYEAHGDEGEDRLLSTLFTTLALRFSDLDVTLEALARATSAPYRASVKMLYRNVDRAEEGGMGVKGVGSFSADLCLIVDPIVDGKPMGRRVTLVQAKRLYRDKKAAKQPKWNSSYKIDIQQRKDLLEQTQSSVYFFHGPPTNGRGVPVIPAQLVADLAGHQGSGTQLFHGTVGVASRSLADWLTYDALALRVGDPYADLVEKAGGRPGSLPRRLLDIPRVEVELSIKSREEG